MPDSPMPIALHKRAPMRAMFAIAVLAALAALLTLASWQARQAAQERDDAEMWSTHTRDVLIITDEVKVDALSAIRGERGYLLTHDAKFLAPFEQARVALPKRIDKLRDLTRDNPEQRALTGQLAEQADRYLETMASLIALTEAGDAPAALDAVKAGVGRNMIEAILHTLGDIERNERVLLKQRQARAEAAFAKSDRFQTLLSSTGFVLLVIVALATNYLRRAMDREEAARRELQRLASSDELTGLANRREFLKALDRGLASSRRNGRPLTLALVDIDHFKRVNDTHGHPAGDGVIRAVADLAAASMRGGDLVGRIGGEEFAILLQDTDKMAAWEVCERLRVQLGQRDIALPNGPSVRVTLSCGVAAAVRDDSADSLIARADQALYDAKGGGRDRVLMAA